MEQQAQDKNSFSREIIVKIDPYDETFISIVKSFVSAPESATVSFEGGWISNIVVEWKE